MGLQERLIAEFEEQDPMGANLRAAADRARELAAESEAAGNEVIVVLQETYAKHAEEYEALKFYGLNARSKNRIHSAFGQRQDAHITAVGSFENALNSQIATRARRLSDFLVDQGYTGSFEQATLVLQEHLKAVQKISVRQRFSGFMHGKSKDVLRLEASVALDAKLAEVFDGNKAMMDAVRDEIEHYAQQIFQSKQMIKAEDRVIRTGEELNKLSIGMLEHFIAMKKIRAELSSLTTDTRLSASFVPPTIEEDGLFSKQSVFDMDALRESYGSEMSVVNIADRIVAAEAALGSTKADKAEGYRSVLGPFRRVVKDAREQVAVIYAKYNGGVPVSTLEVRDDFALTAIASPPPSESTPSQDDIAQRVRAILAPVGDDQSKPFDPDV